MIQDEDKMLLKSLGLEGIPLSEPEATLALMKNQLDREGVSPCTKAQAAANIAGFVIMTKALGQALTSYPNMVQRDGQKWEAVYEFFMPAIEDCSRESADPEKVLLAAVLCLSGLGGEAHKGVGHPNSCLKSSFLAGLYTQYLDCLWQAPITTYFFRAIDFINGVLAYNTEIFNDLFELLMVQEHIPSGSEVECLGRVKPANLNQLKGTLQ